MMRYPDINPIALSLGPLSIHWYGVMYLLGFFFVWLLARYRMKVQSGGPIQTPTQLVDLIYVGALGVVIGGRMGYMLFYDFSHFIHQPWVALEVWQGGMSFHGGLLGVILALFYFARRHQLPFLALMDFIAPMAPIGLALGRLGNFINGELWGRVSDSRFAMIFPNGGPLPRYPSELFEFALEGVLLFIILWVFSIKKRAMGAVSGLFLVGYSLARFTVEFFREPDPQWGYLAFHWLTMGQILSVPMFVLGFYLCLRHQAGLPALDPTKIRKILVLEFNLIGDSIMHEPILRAMKLAMPQARIEAWTNQANYDVLSTHPAVSHTEVIIRKIRGPSSLFKFACRLIRLRGQKFDLLVNFYQSGTTPTIARFSGIPYRLGFNAKKLARTHNIRVQCPSPFSNRSVESLALLRPLGIDPASVWPQPLFFIPAELRNLPQQYLSASHRYVAYNLATSSPYKTWPASHYATLAADIYRDKGWIPLLIGNPGQTHLVDEFLKTYPEKLPFVRLPLLKLQEVAAILKQVECLVSGDTGVMHLGFAISVPTVAIFTEMPPEFCISVSTEKMIVFRQDENKPPLFSGQKQGVFKLSVAEVRDAIEKLLVFSLKSS